MATNVTVNTSYTTDNINNSDKTSSSGAVYSSSSSSVSVCDTPERILEKLLTVDSDDSGLNASTLQGKTADYFASLEHSNTKLSKDGGVMNNTNRVVNLNADLLHGHSIVDAGNNFGGITYIDNDGVMEVGKYLDFHETDTATNDYDGRLQSNGGVPYWNGQQMWNSGNDGAGSGLDADLIHGNQFTVASVSNPIQSPDSLTVNGIGYVYKMDGVLGQSDGALYSAAYSSDWVGQIFQDFRSGQIALRGKNSGTWQPWRTVFDNKNSNLLTVDWSAARMNAASNAGSGGYISSGNYGGTGNASYHPSGIWANGATNWLYGTNYFNGKLQDVNGNWSIQSNGQINIDNIVSNSVAFSSGFQGSGMKLNKDANNKYNLELDNLIVRGGMSVYELTANKVRATNGALYVSDSGKIKSVSDGGTYFVIYLEDVNTFVAGDVVKCQIFTGSGVKSYIFKVDWINSNANGDYVAFTKSTCWLQGGTGANVPAVGDTLVRIASDVANRQGNIYLTSSDTNSPYIQVVDGATSANLAGDVKVRLGKLDGITSTDFGNLTGYGLYTKNAILDNARVAGNISATSGNIGGFSIAASSLSTNYIDLNNTTKSIDLYNTNSNVNSGIRFYYGEKNATPSYVARLNAYRHASDGDIFSIFVSNTLNISANNVKMSGNLNITGTTTAVDLSVKNRTITNDLYVNNNTVIYGNLSVNGITNISLPTYTLTYNTDGAWPSFSSLVLNGRQSGNVYNLNLTFYSSNSSTSWQKLCTITNFSTPGYLVYFTPTTGSVVGENSVGYIANTGEIFIKPGKGGQNYTGQVTWITA